MVSFNLGILYVVYNSNFCFLSFYCYGFFLQRDSILHSHIQLVSSGRELPVFFHSPQALFDRWRENSAHYGAVEIVWVLSTWESGPSWEVGLSSCADYRPLCERDDAQNHQPPAFSLGTAPNENHTLGNGNRTLGNGKAGTASNGLQTRQCLLWFNIINK